MRRALAAFLTTTSALAFTACYSPAIDTCAYACSANAECPDDQVCNAQNLCAASATTLCDGVPAPDDVAPETAIATAPPALTNQAEAMFAFSSSEPGMFECRYDGVGDFEVCPASFTRFFREGMRGLEVVAIDLAGNRDPSPAMFTWQIDLTAPTTTIRVAPPAIDNSAAFDFIFSSTDLTATFECSYENAPFAPCTSPHRVMPITAGAHEFSVRAIDAATNVEAAPPRSMWTTDLSLPETTITQRPPSPTNVTSATFHFTGSEDGTFECRLDGSAYAPCTSPTTYGMLVDGEHVFAVRLQDTSGNIDPSPATHTWITDTVRPVLSVTPPPATVGSRMISLVYSADEPATFSCTLDSAPVICAPMFTVATDGAHTWTIKATDAAGNVSETQTYSFVVDTAPPVVTFSQPMNGATIGPRATIVYDVADTTTTTLTCTLGAVAIPCGNLGRLVGNLPSGAQTFSVTAVDAFARSTTTSVSFTVDCTLQPFGPTATDNIGLFFLDEMMGVQTLANQIAGRASAVRGVAAVDESTLDPTTVAGRFGSALAFTNTQTVSWATGVTTLGQVTAELWYRPTGNAGATGYSILGNDSARFYLSQTANASTLSLRITDPAMPTSTATATTPSTTPLTAGVWHHIVATYDQATAHIFVDGRLAATASLVTSAQTSWANVTLGARAQEGPLSGSIDNLLVTPLAMSGDDVLARYCPLAFDQP